MIRLILFIVMTLSLYGENLTSVVDYKSHTHKVIIPKDWRPYYFIDKNNKPTGFAIDIFEEIAKRKNIKFEYIIVDTWKDLWKPFERGEADIVPNIGITEKRDEFTLFSLPLDTFDFFLYKRANSVEIKKKEDLGNKKVAVVYRSVGENIIKKYPYMQSVVYPNHFEAINALLSGEVDAFLYPKPLLDYTLNNMSLDKKIVSFDKPMYEVKRAMGVSSKHPFLLEPLNEGIVELKNSKKYYEIYKKWFTKKSLYTKEDLIFYVSIALFILVSFVIFSLIYMYYKKMIFTQKDLENKLNIKSYELEQNEAKYKQLVESITDWIWEVDENGIYTYSGPQSMRLLGYRPEELVGISPFSIMPKEESERLAELFIKLAKNNEPITGLLNANYKKDGTLIILETSANPIFDKEGIFRGYRGSDRDVTDRIKLQEKIEQSNKDLQQFAYIASHDLQEPLRMVSSYLQLIERRYKDRLDDSGVEFINFAVDGAKRMKELINGLLLFSRVQTQGREFGIIDTNEAIKNAIDNLSISIKKKNANIIYNDLLPIYADFNQIVQLFQNLISNSIKYCENEPIIEISSKKEANNIVIAIKDNGIGIDEKYYEKIFLIFQRLHTKDKYEGTGLGLAVCKRIVERHNGKIWLSSKENEGSTFYISIPNKG